MEQPVALDLFSGRGGWTDGLLAAGFKVYGFDIKEYEGYKGEFIKRDILEMTAEEIRSYGPSFICCSSPCEQFSVHGMRMFHKNPKHPDMGIKLFNHAKMLCESAGCLYVMENVRAAQKFIGPSVNHCGPFHLWGIGVPAIIPPECYRVSKGTKLGLDKDGTRNGRKLNDMYCKTGSKSKKRKEYASQVAAIPLSLSSYIGQFAMQSIEVHHGRL